MRYNTDSMKAITEHEKRIRQELLAAGVTKYGMKKFAIKYLPKVIHENEHIKGIVYGRYSVKGGTGFYEGTLVATDLRVIFLDHKPGYTKKDIITYDVVSGIKTTTAIFSAVTLHTRLGDFTIRFANPKCAGIFKKYIEIRRLEHLNGSQDLAQPSALTEQPKPAIVSNKEASTFLQSHELATLSTIDRSGKVHGAIVYYFPSDAGYVYILTKAGTNKAHNIFANNQVALTVYDEQTLQTVQMQGTASVETDQTTKQHIFDQIVRPREYGGEIHMPPVTKLQEGAFMIVRISPTEVKFNDYKKFKL